MKLSADRVAKLLDRAALGGRYQDVADEAEVAPSTVRRVLKEFPLWNFFRKNNKKDTPSQ